MNFLRDLAKAHEHHEGYFKPGENPNHPDGSLSYRNNNSGNLRITRHQMAMYGAVDGDGNFARFPTYEIGLRALMDDLRAKITGHSAHIDYSNNPTFLDYVKVYAPSDDGNSPSGYTQSLIKQLQKYNLYPEMRLSEMAKLINQVNVIDIDRIIGALREKIKVAKNVKSALVRRLERLLNRLNKK